MSSPCLLARLVSRKGRDPSLRKIQSEFGASSYMARKAKDLVREKGILATPNPKLGNPLYASSS